MIVKTCSNCRDNRTTIYCSPCYGCISHSKWTAEEKLLNYIETCQKAINVYTHEDKFEKLEVEK